MPPSLLLKNPPPKKVKKGTFNLIKKQLKTSAQSYGDMTDIALALKTTEESELAQEALKLAKECRNKCQELYDIQVAKQLSE